MSIHRLEVGGMEDITTVEFVITGPLYYKTYGKYLVGELIYLGVSDLELPFS